MSDAPLIGEELYMAGRTCPRGPRPCTWGRCWPRKAAPAGDRRHPAGGGGDPGPGIPDEPALLLGVLAAVLVISGLVVGGIFLLRRVRQRRGAR
jgi:hypothetical protein